jgi:hypothetical protein
VSNIPETVPQNTSAYLGIEALRMRKQEKGREILSLGSGLSGKEKRLRDV